MFRPLRTFLLRGLLLSCTLLHLPLHGQVLTAFHPEQKPEKGDHSKQNFKPLISLLNDLEKKHQISFYYDPEVLARKSVDGSILEQYKDRDIEAALPPLLEPVRLIPKKVKQGYYLILPAPKEEKNSAPRSSPQTLIDVPVTGKVVDEKGTPLPGVTIVLKGTASGTTSGPDGTYSISLPQATGTMVFSFVGYQSQEVAIGNRTLIDVTLVPDEKTLQEVLVVGYGVQEKKTLTGAVASVSENELRAVPTGDAAARLQGRVAGVTITSNSAPGGNTVVRVRGIGSINNNDPLYVVDGVPTTSGLTGINPNDIESMTVLKDASSSAIYGSRAANGVIVVTTKRGKSGKARFGFDARQGVQRASNQLELLNTREIGELLWQKYRNMGLSPGSPGWGDIQYGYGPEPVIPDYILPAGKKAGEVDESTYNYPTPYHGITKANKQGTNWYDEIFSAAPIREYNMAVSGGGEKSNYALSAGYMNQEGIVDYTGFKRYSLRSNADASITNWLDIGQSLGVAYSDRSGSSGTGSVTQALRIHPILPVYDIRGNFAGTKSPSTGNGSNPVATLYRAKDDFNRQARIMASTYAQVNFTPDLSFKSLVGVDYNTTRTKNRVLADPEWTQTTNNNILNESQQQVFQYNWANTLTFNKTLAAEHQFNLMLGTEALKNNQEFFNAGRSTFAFTDLDYMVLDAGQKDIVNAGSYDQWALFSYFGRLNYAYKEKYLFEAVTRRDASSRFAAAHRWGTFPAFSAGWRVSAEPFMQDLRWLSDFKLRAGWGKNGNDNVGNYNSYTTYRAAGNESYYNITGTSSTKSEAGLHKYSLGNPEGKWETSVSANVGLDVALLNNKVEANLDVYNRKTTNMLYPDSKPDTYGGVVLPSINIGEMKNTGLDLILTYRDEISKSFSFQVSGNLSHYRNQVIRLNNNPGEIRYGNSLLNEVYTASTAGQPISAFYGYVVEGIFNTQAEVDAHPKYNPDINGRDVYSMPGVLKYKDVNGDGKITVDDRTFIGSPHPDLSYGLNIGLNFKNWDLTLFFQGVAGNDMINYTSREILFTRYDGNYLKKRLYESWTPERYARGEKITVPITLVNDANMQKPSTFFMENGSYARMKDFQIGYTLPALALSKLHLDRLRLYFQATNLFTLTRYSGLDPEISSGNDRHLGVDSGVYPTPQIFMMGLNLNL